MPGKCGTCGEPLFGKQRRFCSDSCRNKYWSRARKLGEQRIQISPDEVIQAFMNDFFRVLKMHQEAIIRIGQKNNVDRKDPD